MSNFKHGKHAELWLAAKDISTWFHSLEVDATVNAAETTTFKAAWKSHLAGLADGKMTADGYYDPTLDSVKDSLAVEAGEILTVATAGMESVGDLARLIVVRTTQYKESSKVGGAVAFSWKVLTDSPIGFGVTLHPMKTESGSGSGAYLDNGASSANGAAIHLHVPTASGITVTVEHSTDHSTWATLASHVFASPGVQRIAVAGTVNRYTRVTWDGAIKFGAALSRG